MPLSALILPPPFVFLTTPEAIVTTTSGSWQTINNATLGAALARQAMLSVNCVVEDNDAEVHLDFHLRQTGSGLVMGAQTQRASTMAWGGGGMHSTEDESENTISTVINLDSSSDFDYYIALAGAPDSWSVTTYLLAYR
jgi:hypothetical protein